MSEVALLPDPFGQPVKPSSAMSPAQRAAVEDGGSTEVARDGYGRYLLPNIDNPKATKAKGYTRATTFAKSISDTYALSMWGLRMAVHGLVNNRDLYAAAASTPLSDTKALNDIAETAKERAGAKAGAMIGTALHAFTEQVDRGETPNIPPLWAKGVAAYTELLDASGFEVVQDLIERIVLEAQYGIAGTFDRIVRATRDVTIVMPDGTTIVVAEGEYVVLDLKTGKDLTYGWNEIAIQLALYARAKWMFDRAANKLVEKVKCRLDVALVIHLPAEKITEDEARATLHGVDIEAGWEAAALCAAVRKWRAVRKLAAPLATVEVGPYDPELDTGEGNVASGPIKVTSARVPVAEVKVMSPTLRQKIDDVLAEPGMYELRTVEQRAKTWTPDADEYAVKRLKKIRAESLGG